MTYSGSRNEQINHREDLLKVLTGETPVHPVFQPRLEHWYRVRQSEGCLPRPFRGLSLIEVHQTLGCAFRPYHLFNRCLQFEYEHPIHVHTHLEGSLAAEWRPALGETEDLLATMIGSEGVRVSIRWSTPLGEAISVEMRKGHSRKTVKYPVTSSEEARIFRYVLDAQRPVWKQESYDEGVQDLGSMGLPVLTIPRVNIQRLSVNLMGFENVVYAIAERDKEVVDLIKACDDADNRICNLLAATPIPMISYGDNIDANLVSPQLYSEFILPAYEQRAAILKPAGKFVFSHWDGAVKTLLRFAGTSFLDGIEALTPKPQGDITHEEMRAALPESMVLLDGLQMLSFMPDYPIEMLESETLRLVSLFGGKAILGISDQLSPACDIERVRRTAEVLRQIDLGLGLKQG